MMEVFPTTWRGVLLGLLVGLMQAAGQAADVADPQKEPAQKFGNGVLVRFEGEINPLSEQRFYRKLSAAQKLKPDLLVVEIESPGGWVDSSLNLAERLRRIDWARTVAFVPREAISGGAVMALGCDDIVMAPDAHLGDAGEIFRDEQGMFRYVEEKARSYLASRLRMLAQAKGRSPALAEAMCDMDLDVFHVRNKETGAEAYMSEQELTSSDKPEQWEKIKPVFAARDKHFLTVTGQEALELKLAQSLASNQEELEKQYGLSKSLVVLRNSSLDTAVVILNTPLMTGLLIVVGLVALYFEFAFPGTFVGGMIASLCFAIFFWSRFLGGTAGWLELILFICGLAFLAMELFVIPGFGIAGFSGIVLIFGSVLMASQTFIVPQSGRELNTMIGHLGTVTVSFVIFLVAAAYASRYLGAIPLARSLVLEVPTGDSAAAAAPKAISANEFQVPVTIGEEGLADSPLRPAGKARFGDHYVDVVSDGRFVDLGKRVRVVEISGNRVVVREVETA